MGGSSLPDALQADLVLMNGKIVTVDAEDSLAEAVAVRDNKILAVGGNEEVMETAGARTRMVDLRGRTVVPGLTDVHLHMMGAGGVGMCGIGEVLMAHGLTVSGCDLADYERTRRLSQLGADIDQGH